jgi:ABC-type antimicrobial peptide transport system permease subunit
MINIGGLAVGLAVAMLIGLWIQDELSYDRYHTQADRVAQAMQNQTFNGQVVTQTAIPIPLGQELKKSYANDFKYVVMSSWTGEHILSIDHVKISKTGNYMDADAPKLLGLKIVAGTINGLKDPGSIMLSRSVSEALFGDKDPINRLMRIDNRQDVKVTAIYEDLPANTGFNELKFIAPFELYVLSEPWIQYARDNNQWGNNSFQLFVQIADHADMEKVNARIKDVKLTVGDESERVFQPEIFLHRMKDWHLRSNWENGRQTGGLIQYVWLFGIVGFFVLLLACINFMNLSTARSEQRAKEVGIRKTIGSVRQQLILQFLSESLLTVLLAFVFSLILLLVSIPMFNQLSGKEITFPLSSANFWLISLGFVLITGFLSGSYPALYLSSFQPVKVLKGTFRRGRFSALPRKVLVVLQFSVSVSLIIGTIIVYHQIQHTKNRPVGYDRNGIMMIEMKSPDFYGKYDLLRNELKKTGAIEEMAESSSPLTGVWSNNGGFDWEGRDPDLQPEFATIWVSHDFGKTISWEIKDGRDFSRNFSTDSSALIINEAAVKFMGLNDPIGKIVRYRRRDYTIIGVIEDMLMESPFKAVKQTVYFLDYENVNWIDLKLNPIKSFTESTAQIEEVFNKYLPDVPFDFKFADREHTAKFESEERVGTLSAIFAALAIFISCLGLFGLASFVAEQRTKEIGIRKVLGASIFSLWKMLSTDFILLVIISAVLAVPGTYYVLENWLQNYEYRTDISAWTFLISIFGAVLITLATVSFQAVNAALMNPVSSLRSE